MQTHTDVIQVKARTHTLAHRHIYNTQIGQQVTYYSISLYGHFSSPSIYLQGIR